MPRRERPATTSRSEHWLRVAVNDGAVVLDERIRASFSWSDDEVIVWRSPVADDEYAEYYDEEFLERLGITDLRVPLLDFWPRSGPRWDGLALTTSGKRILVEAKAYPEEAVDGGSQSNDPRSLEMIAAALHQARVAFGAAERANWATPFYQYANRLAHLYFLAEVNELDAYLVFLYFANAPDVPNPCTAEQWVGAKRIVECSLGLSKQHKFSRRVATVIMEPSECSGTGKQSQVHEAATHQILAK